MRSVEFGTAKRWARGEAIDVALLARSIPMIGRRHRCACCGWTLRAFTQGRMSLRSKPNGYCPRCNSKPRHRWLWLWLEDHTDLFKRPLDVLHVAPAMSTSRAFERIEVGRYVAVGLERRDRNQMQTDLGHPGIRPGVFDLAICVHVLEHADDDRALIRSLYELLKPGGTAAIGVPLDPDRPTIEDPSVTDPDARRALFGEPDHRRWYGPDLSERLADAGFEVQQFTSRELSESVRHEYGVKPGEALFLCRKEPV